MSPLTETVGVAMRGGLIVAALTALARFSGIIAAEANDWMLLGAGVAWLLGTLGVALKFSALASTQRAAAAGTEDGKQSMMRLQAAVLGDFLLNLIVVAIGIFGLSFAGVKFSGQAGFAIAYATGAFTMQVVGGLALSRASRSTDSAVVGAAPGSEQSTATSRGGSPAESVDALVRSLEASNSEGGGEPR